MESSDVSVWHAYILGIFFVLLLSPSMAQNTTDRRCYFKKTRSCILSLSTKDLQNIQKCHGNPNLQSHNCFDLMCTAKTTDSSAEIRMKCDIMTRILSSSPCCIIIQSSTECLVIRIKSDMGPNSESFYPPAAACESPPLTITTSQPETPQNNDNSQGNTSPGLFSRKNSAADSESLSALSIGVIVAGVIVSALILIGFAVWKWTQKQTRREPALFFSRSPKGLQAKRNDYTASGGTSAWEAPASTYETSNSRNTGEGDASYDTPPKHKSAPDNTHDQSVYTTIDNESSMAPPGYSTFTRSTNPLLSNDNTNYGYSNLDEPKPSACFDDIMKENRTHAPGRADRVGQEAAAVKTTDLDDADLSYEEHYVVLEDEENPSSKTPADQNYFELEKDSYSSPPPSLADNEYFQLEMEQDVQMMRQADDEVAENKKDPYFEIERDDIDSSTCSGENDTNDEMKAQDDITHGSANKQTAIYIELEKEESTENEEGALYQLATAITQ